MHTVFVKQITQLNTTIIIFKLTFVTRLNFRVHFSLSHITSGDDILVNDVMVTMVTSGY